MVEWQTKSTRKPSGGMNNSLNARDKREAEKGGFESETKISDRRIQKKVKGLGGNTKQKLFSTSIMIVSDPKTGKSMKAELETVKENAANRQFTRENVLSRGAKVQIKLDGKSSMARVTSRSGQSGQVSGVLLDEAPVTAVASKKPKKR